MYIPCARERVNLAGRREVFFVLTVNPDANTVDLIPLNGVAYIEHGIPLAFITPYDEERLLEEA